MTPAATFPAPAAVAVEGLTKRYGTRFAVADLTVEIPRGVVAGFIGPNGSGKTTTMAMLLGLVRPTSGSGTVLGEPLAHPERFLSQVGALVEGPALWPGLTATENLRLLARLGGHPPARVPEVLELVGLSDRATDRAGRFSFGMKQRLGIAAALIGDPALLVLDEPTNGLDPVGISEMRDLIARLASKERTVLVSSHLLGELEHVCDWLLVIEGGRLRYAGHARGFGSGDAPEILLDPLDPAALPVLAEVLAARGRSVTYHGDRLVVRAAGEDLRDLAAGLNAAASSAGVALAELQIRRPTLESSYLRLVEASA
jgi:ABC-2 type transport system ATP-binding protein